MSLETTAADQPLIVSIGGATAQNHAEAENTANNINILQDGTGQRIDIDQNATAVVNNMIAIIIGPPYPINFNLNDDDRSLDIKILKDGQVKLNGEEMEIKELENGIKVMFLRSDKQETALNDKA